jgi:hypothetical protein
MAYVTMGIIAADLIPIVHVETAQAVFIVLFGNAVATLSNGNWQALVATVSGLVSGVLTLFSLPEGASPALGAFGFVFLLVSYGFTIAAFFSKSETEKVERVIGARFVFLLKDPPSWLVAFLATVVLASIVIVSIGLGIPLGD